MKETKQEKTLKMRKFKVPILTNPPVYEIALGLAKVERKTVEIEGYTLKDAMKRAGIQ